MTDDESSMIDASDERPTVVGHRAWRKKEPPVTHWGLKEYTCLLDDNRDWCHFAAVRRQ
jgi:hypothetical protein